MLASTALSESLYRRGAVDVVIEAEAPRFLIPVVGPSNGETGDMALTLGGMVVKLWTTTGKARGDRRGSTRIELYCYWG